MNKEENNNVPPSLEKQETLGDCCGNCGEQVITTKLGLRCPKCDARTIELLGREALKSLPSNKEKKTLQLVEVLRELHSHTLYKLNEHDDRQTHAPSELFDKVESILSQFKGSLQGEDQEERFTKMLLNELKEIPKLQDFASGAGDSEGYARLCGQEILLKRLIERYGRH